MSLKTDYLDGSNGFTQQMADVFAQGELFVSSNSVALASALQTAASKGQKKFTVTIETTFEPANLRLNGLHLQTYLAGIQAALASEDVYNYEVTLALNTSLQTTTSIDFNFSF
jgi:DsbC/DsbD-like thiol-disulfide interchange protein